MVQQAKNGYELETELKLVISEKQYKDLVQFIWNSDNSLEANRQVISVFDYQQKTRDYRDFDTPTYYLMEHNASLTARHRGKTYAVTAKFPAQHLNSRHEYTESVPSENGDFFSLDFLSMPLEPIEEAKNIVPTEIGEVLRRKIITNRANLYVNGRCLAELAVDKVSVKASRSTKEQEFYELEIESKSEECDISSIGAAIQHRFGPMRNADYSSKYEKAVKLTRS